MSEAQDKRRCGNCGSWRDGRCTDPDQLVETEADETCSLHTANPYRNMNRSLMYVGRATPHE